MVKGNCSEPEQTTDTRRNQWVITGDMEVGKEGTGEDYIAYQRRLQKSTWS